MMKRPTLIIIAGPNGSGKTSLTKNILKHEWIAGCEYINPDLIARDIFGDWNSPEMVKKAAQYAEERREDCLNQRRSLIFETVLSAPDKLYFVQRARNADYFIRLFFVGTDSPEINAMHVAKRVMQGGHDVPIPKIISRYYKSIANCMKLSEIVDKLYVYDNSINNRLAELLFLASSRKFIKQYAAMHDWAKPIYEHLTFDE